MNNNELCHFFSSQNRNGCLLLGTICTGKKSKAQCKFKKTSREYCEEYNRAIMINRLKGNCDRCKYTTVKCVELPIPEDEE